MPDALLSSNLNLPGLRRGKVRDVYDLPDDRLLIIATDRISAFDVVMPTPVPGKGRLLTSLSTFWLRFIESRGLCPTHLLSTDVANVPGYAFSPGGTTPSQLRGRATLAAPGRPRATTKPQGTCSVHRFRAICVSLLCQPRRRDRRPVA